jgi:hypothetical protein
VQRPRPESCPAATRRGYLSGRRRSRPCPALSTRALQAGRPPHVKSETRKMPHLPMLLSPAKPALRSGEQRPWPLFGAQQGRRSRCPRAERAALGALSGEPSMEIQASPLTPYFFQSAKFLRGRGFKDASFSELKFLAVVVNRECALPVYAPVHSTRLLVASWSEPSAWAIHKALPRRHILMRSTEVHYPFAFTMSGLHRFGLI